MHAESDDQHLICCQQVHPQLQAHPPSPPLTNSYQSRSVPPHRATKCGGLASKHGAQLLLCIFVSQHTRALESLGVCSCGGHMLLGKSSKQW